MVVVDTDIFIAAMRQNKMAETLLRKYENNVRLSAITVMELFVGAKTAEQKKAIENILDDHEVIMIEKSISTLAIRLVKENNSHARSLHLPDALIAATCLEHQASLLTFNTKDFKFIKGLKFAK
jgi:predicted nucleic acid-binding protein